MKDVNYYKTHKDEKFDLENTKVPETYKEGIQTKCVECASNYINAYKCKNYICPLYELKKKSLKKPHKASKTFLEIRKNIKDNKRKEKTIHTVYKIQFLDGSYYRDMSYIGKHTTKDINDDYVCSSKLVNKIINEKDDKGNLVNPYKRTILKKFNNETDAIMYEKVMIANMDCLLNKEKQLSLGKYRQYRNTLLSKYPNIKI